ncbi:MAG TPA: lipopolysaccharide kinase InaA family protein [Thermoanaerobaculia bacterium]|nr:lipopolysaccharide kinase InaA family protein [Thermoanaerobaculia bacterium]
MNTEPFSIPGWTGELNAGLRPSDPEGEVRRLIDPGSALKTLHWGRNYLYVTRMETGDVVVKQFRHDRLRARLNRRLRGSKAERSWKAARALLDAGILTPEPVMRIESVDEAGPSFYVCRFLDGVLEARYLLRAANAGTETEQFPEVDFPRFLEELGKTARKLHEAGFWFRDFTSGNVLIREGALYLIDLNRTRIGKVPSLSERMRDLARMPILRPEHQEIFLSGYWGGGRKGRSLYLLYHHGFLLKNRTKQKVRGGTGRVKALLLPRTAHAHIPEAPSGAPIRDRVVWDHLSDQPHQHASRLGKMRVRLADARSHLEEAAVVASALPRIRSCYRELKQGLHREPVPFQGCGIALRPWPNDPSAPGALLDLVDDLGAKHVLLRLHPWEEDHDAHDAEEDLARELHSRGLELTFALPQNRELVKDPARWRRALEEIGPRFAPYGKRFQVGQAINRSKWGIWNLNEYVTLVQEASDVLRREPGVEILGPSVIDFEHHVAAAVLNLRRPDLRFDAVSALLYVDRRGAPENPQAGFDTEGKVLLLKAIADTARNSTGRIWITEVNWPLREGPHSPAGQAVSVGEQEQADYLVRYYLLALGTGAVERVFWWQMIAKGYGLVDPVGLRRRPAFDALRTLIGELEGSRLEEVLPVPAPARLWLFRRPDGEQVAVGWSTAGAVRVALPDGREVEVGSSPSYFRLSITVLRGVPHQPQEPRPSP